jgi:hypothetical protein
VGGTLANLCLILTGPWRGRFSLGKMAAFQRWVTKKGMKKELQDSLLSETGKGANMILNVREGGKRDGQKEMKE